MRAVGERGYLGVDFDARRMANSARTVLDLADAPADLLLTSCSVSTEAKPG